MKISDKFHLEDIYKLKNTVLTGKTEDIKWRIHHINIVSKLLDENKKEIPTAIVMWGKAINGYRSLFNLLKKFVKYNFANIAWDNIKEIKVDKIPTEIDK